jgi:hypothetical protein
MRDGLPKSGAQVGEAENAPARERACGSGTLCVNNA